MGAPDVPRVRSLRAPQGQHALTTTVDTPSRDVERADDDLPFVGASASVADDGETYVTVTNLDCRDGHTVDTAIEGGDATDTDVDAQVLFEGQAPDLEVNASNADEFAADDLDVDVEGDVLSVDLAPSTVASISI